MIETSSFLNDSKSIFCVKNIEGKVLYQNAACTKLCGALTDSPEVCTKNCMTVYKRDSECPQREEGTSYFPSELVEESFYDIFFMNDGEFLTSILYPLENRYEADLKYFSQFEKLTGREMDILALKIKRVNNNDICDKLQIKRDTLKKYVTSIYQKLSPEASNKLRHEYRA